MTQSNEIEAKVLLPEKTYHKLCTAFARKSMFNQANYYFDTANGLLKTKRISCRIRLFSDRGEQTLKVPSTNPTQEDFHEAVEVTDELSVQEATSLVERAQHTGSLSFSRTVGDYLRQHFDQTNLPLQTFSKTHRTLVNGPQNCELTLDETQYPDGYTDFELEIENTDPDLIKLVFQQLQKTYDFSAADTKINQAKIARAFRHRAKI
ncbi:CYTH domain-containing protein [Lactobacillus xylocopicola]|uniref:Adenylate cyclase n=1 Tax=Lactobacillus xylocopicola TaxID=2976676 RepID=A0ABN6SIR0_9LACO|nr:CYTH domain-containing protein [Lactobacillus xylocopicola]BDR60218.1 adenylate cyclase [Lactobacillus xylocopicola]